MLWLLIISVVLNILCIVILINVIQKHDFLEHLLNEAKDDWFKFRNEILKKDKNNG